MNRALNQAFPLATLDAEPDGSDTIQVGGVERFCQDLRVDPSDPAMLWISWRMEAATMCVYSREEWQRGFNALGVDSIDQLRGTFDQLKEALRDADNFRHYYTFCFNFSISVLGNQESPHFHDFRIFGRVHDSQKQLFLTLETPDDSEKSRRIACRKNRFLAKLFR